MRKIVKRHATLRKLRVKGESERGRSEKRKVKGKIKSKTLSFLSLIYS